MKSEVLIRSLDHCGSLPYLTEMCGYDGPVYMTHPTRAICPLLLEDYRKITVDRRGEPESKFFTSDDIKKCMKKVVVVNLHELMQVDEEMSIMAYYAGHVLGAAMFLVKVGGLSVVYTGDYNTTPDRHLGAAWIDQVRPTVLITESTYATTLRDSKRARERDFLKKVHECVSAGGKVLIPVFALGRAQELCILIEDYWERMQLKVPIYFSAGFEAKMQLNTSKVGSNTSVPFHTISRRFQRSRDGFDIEVFHFYYWMMVKVRLRVNANTPPFSTIRNDAACKRIL